MRAPSRPQVVTALLALLLVVIAVLGQRLIVTLRWHQHMRTDLAELQDVKYGLLNADAWVGQVTAIIEQKINEFEFTDENREAIKATLERMLEVLIVEADRQLRKQEKSKKLSKRVKENIRQQLVDIETVKAGVPRYADQIISEFDKPKARRQLNEFLKNVLADVTHSTFSELDMSRIEAIREAYGCLSRASCQEAIAIRIMDNQRLAIALALSVLLLILAMFVAVSFLPSRNRFALLALACVVLMATGVITPMIEVEARISSLRFMLLGTPVEFSDQVLYFQSKSVLDVVTIMTRTGKWDMIIVGILIMTFSVIFPLGKLGSSLGYLYGPPRVRDSRVIQFFALKSGKWSMADVFVVAMFMAYIGFSGLIASQLSTFALASAANVDVLTTNGTSLQIGFFMFLAFCLMSLWAATLMESGAQRDRAAAVAA